ncbi:uncharacterized protein LOC141927697 [Strix aluco]|uniref:uncharacterized protein LOC141927697 n=1 Tax=Strix aluco TaxID=111821 RepID=UPI003DA4D553
MNTQNGASPFLPLATHQFFSILLSNTRGTARPGACYCQYTAEREPKDGGTSGRRACWGAAARKRGQAARVGGGPHLQPGGPARAPCSRRRPPLLSAALRPTGSDHGCRPLVTGALLTPPLRAPAQGASCGEGAWPPPSACRERGGGGGPRAGGGRWARPSPRPVLGGGASPSREGAVPPCPQLPGVAPRSISAAGPGRPRLPPAGLGCRRRSVPTPQGRVEGRSPAFRLPRGLRLRKHQLSKSVVMILSLLRNSCGKSNKTSNGFCSRRDSPRTSAESLHLPS